MKEVELQTQVVEWLNTHKEVRKVNYSEVTVDTLSGFNKLLVSSNAWAPESNTSTKLWM